MKKIRLKEINDLIADVEKYTIENVSGRERIKHLRKKIVELGAKEKKYFIPFKRGLKLLERKREKSKKARMEKKGIFF
ncbi:hypothetical protein CWI36_1338p0010 [Hamiltosporidium magnivora]|uniref:Uncharacterized protein n=1 Tax=Hamiltosporidium magnivora TaxID=148818 RepID=A0A4Q9L238_9MICR|nr:hypothetical protein CWI36_1338p0010 [Hamiltosporidium magnivora]